MGSRTVAAENGEAMTRNKSAFISAAAIKWGGVLWVSSVIARITYRYLSGKLSLDWDLVGYAVFSLLICCSAGCILGALMWRRRDREDPYQKS